MSEIKRTDTRSVDKYIEALSNSYRSGVRTASAGNNVVGIHTEGLPTIITGGLRLSQMYGDEGGYDPADIKDDNDLFMDDEHLCPACHSRLEYDDATENFICVDPECPDADPNNGPYHDTHRNRLDKWRDKQRNQEPDIDDDFGQYASTSHGRKAKVSNKFVRVSQNERHWEDGLDDEEQNSDREGDPCIGCGEPLEMDEGHGKAVCHDPECPYGRAESEQYLRHHNANW